MNSAYQVVFRNALLALVIGLVCVAPAWAASPGKIVVQVNKPGAKISPLLYGLMTEEITFSYEGGLYGELIRNRFFKSSCCGPSAPPLDAVNAVEHPLQVVPKDFAMNDASSTRTHTFPGNSITVIRFKAKC
jgi:hypothetical protein